MCLGSHLTSFTRWSFSCTKKTLSVFVKRHCLLAKRGAWHSRMELTKIKMSLAKFNKKSLAKSSILRFFKLTVCLICSRLGVISQFCTDH